MNRKPNIVYILNDHQAWYGHGMAQGGPKPMRPNFEKFAAEGMEFTNAYCVTPMCGPARRSMLTGLYPHTHGQVHNENDPPYRHDVYLDILAENGYTNYYYGKWHAGPGCAYDHHCTGLSQSGYGNPYNTPEYAEYCKKRGLPRAQHMVERALRPDSYENSHFFKKLKEGELYQCEDYWCGEHAIGLTVTPKETHEAFFLANLACDKLEELAKQDSDEPWSLRVDFWGPHQPFFPTKEFADLYDPESIPMYPSFENDLHDKPENLTWEVSRPLGDGKHIIRPNPLPWSEWQKMLARCYAHITMVDAADGLVVDKLRELGLDENTIVIWTTDHGDAIACQGGHFDKDSHMAQEVERIPMAIRWPGSIQPGQTSDRLVFTCDLPVTMLDAAGLAFPERVDGKSLLELGCHRPGEKDWRTSLMCETYGHGYGLTLLGRMVVDENNIKYTCFEGQQDELYDLNADPYEMKNLACLPEYDDLKQKMRQLLRQKQQESCDPVPLEQLLP